MTYRYTHTLTHTHTGSYRTHLRDLSPKNNNKKHLPRSQRAPASALQPRCVLEERIIWSRGLRLALFTPPLTGGRGRSRAAFGTAVYSPPLGGRGAERGDFFCYEAVAARMVGKKKTYKQKNGGDELIRSFFVWNQNCYVRRREHRAEMRSPAGGTKTNWTKTKTAL